MPKSRPELAITEIADLVLRGNFKALKEYFDTENQLQGFKFITFTVTQNENNIKINHGLAYPPKDIVVTRLIAPSAAKLVLNHGLFDSSNLDLSVTGLGTNQKLNCRMFVGTFWNDSTTDTINSTDTQEFKSKV